MLENLVGRRLGPLFAGAPPRCVNNMSDILHEARSAPNRTLRPQARIRIRLDNEDATLIVHPQVDLGVAAQIEHLRGMPGDLTDSLLNPKPGAASAKRNSVIAVTWNDRRVSTRPT